MLIIPCLLITSDQFCEFVRLSRKGVARATNWVSTENCYDGTLYLLCILLDSTSVATEYSLKFDESMTEDEIEEKSFRSLLPSESHRRFNMEKKRGHHDDSDEETSPEKPTLSSAKVCFSLPVGILHK